MTDGMRTTLRGSGNYARCRLSGCTYKAGEDGLCPRHSEGRGGRTPPSARQMAASADVLKRFAGSRELSDEEHSIVTTAADIVGIAALAEHSRRA